MDVILKPPAYSEKEILRNLLELYLYELSPYSESIEMNQFGLFGYRYLDHYWTDKDRHVFLIFADDNLAGFVMVRKFDYSGDNQDYRWLMSEFFVLKKFQNKGVGRSAAHQIFNHFSGPWIVAQIEGHVSSQKFWKKVISEYTHGEFKQSKLGKQPAQEFTSNSDLLVEKAKGK